MGKPKKEGVEENGKEVVSSPTQSDGASSIMQRSLQVELIPSQEHENNVEDGQLELENNPRLKAPISSTECLL